ncbi:MAG: hypothetical protein FWG04_04335 [Desulfovibrionaceae bacterium]|nr:hypothetical protein [Desulfovibrionaceae bacterium]
MKKHWFSLLGAVLAVTLMVSTSYANDLSGTYVDAKGKNSVTFSGNKMIQKMYGAKMEAAYELKDGFIVWTNAGGNVIKTPYKLEGNTLTLDEGKYAETYTKK